MAKGRKDYKGLAKAALNDGLQIALVLVLGALQFGWIFWPRLGILGLLVMPVTLLCLIAGAFFSRRK